MNHKAWLAAVTLAAGLVGGAANAAVFDISLTGDRADFSESMFTFDGFNFDRFSLPLSPSDGFPATVSQGDTIDATVTLDGPYTIPQSAARTYILQYFNGDSFPPGNTGVNGTFTFFEGVTQVAQFGYDSTTSNGLASFAANFPPNNGAFTFDSFTNDFTINTLGSPGTLDNSSFEYDLLSNAVPEPAIWVSLLLGLGLAGSALRHGRRTGAALSQSV
jgi:hypothetical protein